MAQGHTFCQHLHHFIFSTKDRRPTIDESFRERLWAYMAGVAREEFGFARRIGGTSDHVHALVEIRPAVAVAHAMNRFKSLSCGWVHQTYPQAAHFRWQAGYASFTVSPSKTEDVVRYIERQAEHHARVSFEEEFVAFLKRHGIAFDPQRVFE